MAYNSIYLWLRWSMGNAMVLRKSCLLGLLVCSSAWGQTYTGEDIGAVATSGSHSVAGSVVTINASGADIWGTSDEFYFYHYTLVGDGEISAKIVSITNTHEWTKANVMMRESIAPNSKYAMMMMTPGVKGADFEYRTTTGGSAGPSGQSDLSSTLPHWVRVRRTGDLFEGFKSSDGITWTLYRSITISMSASIEIGLALTSHVDGTLATAVFDDINGVSTPTACPWDSSILQSDPLCVECPWVSGILESNPLCIEPPPPPSRTLSWTNPTENTDATPLDDLAGIYIYDADTDARIYTYLTTTPGATEQVTFDTTSLCFKATAFDTSNNESVYSGTACYVPTEDGKPYIL